MNERSASDGFFSGLISGALAGLLTALIVVIVANSYFTGEGSSGWTVDASLSWAWRNLGLSLPVFAVILILYFRSLFGLRNAVERTRPIDQVAHAEHLTDTWTSLFFGVGVIWTAIGMRGALLYALGDPADSASEGAFAVLQRMVNGGILVALSTTIFGGIGGYLMRVLKTVFVGAALKRYYDQATQQKGDEIKQTLDAIERHLSSMNNNKEERTDEPTAVESISRPRHI